MITVRNLCKDYRIAKRDKNFLRYLFSRQYENKRAVDNVNFSVGKGELVGYIGPNGAGKSTTIKMMTGIMVPTSGEITVMGNVPHLKRKVNAKNIGVVFGQRTQLWWDLPVVDSFDLLRRIYSIPRQDYQDNLLLFESVLDIKSFIDKPVRQLSLGQRMRADLAAALLHNPSMLFLDEPTIGLDIVVKKQIRQFIRKVRNERDLTVILTTHDMRDVEEICDRIVMIDHGKIMLDMKTSDVRDKLGGANTLIVDFDEPPQAVDIPFVEVASIDGPRWTFTFQRNNISASDLIARISALVPVADLSLKEPDIEDVIRDIYEGNIVL
ncbi:MAG: ATP-binding cassette domain-containing protein [Bacillota bacterium]